MSLNDWMKLIFICLLLVIGIGLIDSNVLEECAGRHFELSNVVTICNK